MHEGVKRRGKEETIVMLTSVADPIGHKHEATKPKKTIEDTAAWICSKSHGTLVVS